jgi:hypothetical protein
MRSLTSGGNRVRRGWDKAFQMQVTNLLHPADDNRVAASGFREGTKKPEARTDVFFPDLATYHSVDLAYPIIRLMDGPKSTDSYQDQIQLIKKRKTCKFETIGSKSNEQSNKCHKSAQINTDSQ